MTATPLGSGRFEVIGETTRTIAHGIRRGHETWVFVNGETWVIDAREPSGRARHHDDAALSSPMPATVVTINVSPGQTVKAGDTLVVLEAMKMELAITAPLDGTVRSIACRVGELVQPGRPLVAVD